MRNRLIDLKIPFISKWLDRWGLQKTIREMYEDLDYVERSVLELEEVYSESPSPSPSPEITEDDGLE